MTQRLNVAAVTGSRAEFGLLRPAMRALRAREDVQLFIVAAGSHLIAPAESFREVRAFASEIDAPLEAVSMQVAGRTGRDEDAEALGVGVQRFARALARLGVRVVLVLGDRIEAFAAAAAASVGGRYVAHVHGGDRAEGVSDEAMRHAITKLAHLHLAATPASAERIIRMGEPPETVHVTGSPAIDELSGVTPLVDAGFQALGRPEVVFLMHPIGRDRATEHRAASEALRACFALGRRVLALHPNHDPGREGTLDAIAEAGVAARAHLPREQFLGLLRRLAAGGGVLVGNSSAALIEAAALRLPVVNIGARQAGRERAGNAVDAGESMEEIRSAIDAAGKIDRASLSHPYGDGRAGERIASIIAEQAPRTGGAPRKRCAY